MAKEVIKTPLLKQRIKVLAMAQVAGPGGIKLVAGKVYELEDSAYVRVLIKSGTASLIDPASLDLVFLEKAGYELQDGYSYPPQPAIETLVKKESDNFVEKESTNSVKKTEEIFMTKVPKKENTSTEKADNDASEPRSIRPAIINSEGN